jgi:hypothetical protein
LGQDRYRAGISNNNKMVWFGVFKTAEEGAKAYNDWVKNVRTVEHTDTNWVLEIIDDECETHLISDLNLLEHLRTCWAKGDRTFVEPQNIDYDIIDCIVQELCFGELVYG